MTDVSITDSNLNLTFMQGSRLDSADLMFVWKAGDPAEPVDLTGWSAQAHFRARITDEQPLIELTSGGGTILLNNPEGGIALIIKEDVSAALTKYRGVWDLELTSPVGKTQRLLQGAWTMTREVTRT